MPDFVGMRFVCNECRCTRSVFSSFLLRFDLGPWNSGVCGSCVVDRLVNPRVFSVLYPQYAENLDAIITQVPSVQRKSNPSNSPPPSHPITLTNRNSFLLPTHLRTKSSAIPHPHLPPQTPSHHTTTPTTSSESRRSGWPYPSMRRSSICLRGRGRRL